MSGERLKFRIRIQPLTPVHIGIGNRFLAPGALHLYGERNQQQLAILRTRPLAERLLDHYGHLPNLTARVRETMEKGAYPPAIAREIESGPLALRRMDVHPGAAPYLREGLKEIAALASGLPYIPGSSVKGALRTMWLDWQVQQPGAYGRFRRDVESADPRRRDRADDDLMNRAQVAQTLTGVRGDVRQPQNRDLFRAVQVSDLTPDRSGNLTRAYAVQTISYQVRGYSRAADGGDAGARAWECLRPEANAWYTGTVTVDLSLLEKMACNDPDATALCHALKNPEAWQRALSKYTERVYDTEKVHYNMLVDLDEQRRGIPMREVRNFVRELDGRAVFPMGMGNGLLVHSILGAYNPGFNPDDPNSIEYLGDEEGQSETLLGDVLKLGKSVQGYEYQPAPKSRRVTGTFPDKRRPQDMTVERPLGWTRVSLQPA